MIKKFFLDVARTAPAGVLAICSEGIIRFANPALCQIFGYEESALIGKPIEMLLPAAKRAGHRPLRDGFFREPSSRGVGDGRTLFGLHAEGWQVAVEIGLGSVGEGAERLSVALITDVSIKKTLRGASLPRFSMRCRPGCS